ncbi:MAG: tyrosine-type recombinase/integrase [Victivallaceae bacterium]|nr:tyrosine-type recombinase/integrase [Victivallaceae bacterium]
MSSKDAKKVSLQCTDKKTADKKAKEILFHLQAANTKEKIAIHIAEARNIIKRKANIYGFHSFRHSFVSFCAKAGVPLPVVQAIVGHGNPAITRHYIHIGEESVKQAINALPQGNLLPESENKKNAKEKNREISTLLNSKTQLTETEMQILKILQ